MAKRKARTTPYDTLPAKKVMAKIADNLWSLAVRNDCLSTCAVCKKYFRKLHAHHIIPRRYAATRYEVWNGIGLCMWDHRNNPKLAPHQNAAGWMAWLTTNMPARAEWYMQNRNPEFRGVKDEEYYISAIRSLKEYMEPEDFTRIVGVRFEAWLEETHVDDTGLES